MKIQFQQKNVMSCDITRNKAVIAASNRKQTSCSITYQNIQKCSPLKSFKSIISVDESIFLKQRELLNQNQSFSYQLLDFKKYLYKSEVTTNTERSQLDRPKNVINKLSELENKKKLQSKLQEAFQKLQELKQAVKKHQRDKAEILAKSDKRKANIEFLNMPQDSF